ncbi:MAG: pyridoxal phosphate-dependent aminotransferase [bacterium]|nr:pyridoxal phosphate-dependent aminotransferase [bacterium]
MERSNELEERNRHFDALASRSGLMWLGQNTNHFEPCPAVRQAMIDCIDSGECHRYAPPLGVEELRGAILEDLGLDRDFSVMVTDGAIEGLYHACHTLLGPDDEFVVTDPGWLWPRRFAASRQARVVELSIYDRDAGFRMKPSQLREAMTEKTRLIYLVDPNNPMGSIQTAVEIEEIASIARDAGAYLVHDCTYRDFAEGHTLAARHYPQGTITTYSFSKWLGLAGLRLGAVVASPEIINLLASAPPNNLGSSFIAQRAALAGLRHKAEWFPGVQDRQRTNQTSIKQSIDRVEGLKTTVFPSHGNFLAIDTCQGGFAPDSLCAFYLERGILIRHGGYHSTRCGDRFVKVSTTVPSEWIDAFCGHLEEAIEWSRSATVVRTLY